ncbi:hypothetical protein IMCC3317_09910 [Kordia antarctica]|uniref:Uncharacterized protein n=1 Tax=Kordia antarctica TaxID=1218801 RepID=A0A7L4ZG78_9FLAO|nr:hypothetical protein IMCC3317_09910 [Kordia antarctica]
MPTTKQVNYKPVVHFDKIRQFESILRLKMSKICIENRILNIFLK